MSYANETIMAIYEKELQANIGNLFSRIARSKVSKWSTQQALEAARRGDFDNIASFVPQRSDEPDQPDFLGLESTLDRAPDEIRQDMDETNLSNALQGIFKLLQNVHTPTPFPM
jgi:methionyl-tRNA synthetase